MIQLSIANDFSKTPGVRYPEEGEFSGQQFREDFLKPKVDEAISKEDETIFLFSIFIIIITILNHPAKVHISKKVCNT